LVESVGPAALLLLLALFCVSTPMPVLERIAGLVFFLTFWSETWLSGVNPAN
jgi:hypothetical protein